MRYFYSDPLAAAYMAKHFGMRFQQEHGGVFADRDFKSFIDNSRGLSDPENVRLCISFEGKVHVGTSTGSGPIVWAVDRHYSAEHVPDKLYVHPKSLRLLEPKDGDKDEDGYVYHAKLKWWLREDSDGKGTGHVFNKGCISQTAKRDGKHFFFPEREDA